MKLKTRMAYLDKIVAWWAIEKKEDNKGKAVTEGQGDKNGSDSEVY